MNGSLTMLAFAMASLGGVTPPEHIPPSPAPGGAYQQLDCIDLMRAAEVVDEDLADAWDRQETLVRHRFGAPAPIVRRSEMRVSQLKGELEAIWRVADRKGCGEAPQATDLAWAPGREPGPMLGDPRDQPGPEAFGPEEDQPGPEAEAAYAEEPAFEDEPQPTDMAAVEDDLAGGPPADEPDEVQGYGEPEPQADPRAMPPPQPAPPRRDAGPARWPSASDRPAASVDSGRSLDDVDWPRGD